MAKIILDDLANLFGNPTSAQNTVNENNTRLETAFENTLSRDGSSPNQMNSDFDMNNFDILNVDSIDVDSILIDGRPIPNLEEISEIAEEVFDARDEAVAAASSAQNKLDSRAYAIASFHPLVAPNKFDTAGYYNPGDGGGASYKIVGSEPSHAAKTPITTFSGDTFWYEIDEEVISAKQVGALSGSALDQTSALQSWLSAVSALSVEGYLSSGVYKTDGTISLTGSDVTIRCHRKAILDGTSAPIGTWTIRIEGSIGIFNSGTGGNFGLGVTRIRTGTSFAQSLVVGDVIKIKSADIYDSNNTVMLYGELNVVTGVVDAATGYIDIERPLSANYTTTIQVAKLSPIRNTHWIGGKVLGAIAEQNNQKAILLNLSKDCKVLDLSAERMDDRAISVTDSCDFEIIPGVISDARPSSTGYGVSVQDAVNDGVIHHGFFNRVRHSFSTNNATSAGGIPRRISFADNMINGGAFARGGSMGPGDGIDTHGAAEKIYIERNTVTGCPGQAINFECRSGVIRDNKIINPASAGIAVHNESDFNPTIIVTGNHIINPGTKGIYISNGARGTPTANYESVIVSSNLIEGLAGSTEAIQIGYSSDTRKMRGVVITGNVIKGFAGTTVYLQNTRKAIVASNNITTVTVANPSVRLYDSTDFTISGNNITMPTSGTSSGILVTGTSAGASINGVITGNTVTPESGTITGSAVRLDNNVQQVGVYSNNVRGTGGVTLGTGTGNAQGNNIT